MGTMVIKKLLRCARCGQDHENLEFKQFTNSTCLYDMDDDGPYDYWVMCPIVNEPILLVDIGDDSNE